MKFQRHKRKESFSVLLVSNTDRHSRQFQISLFSIRLAGLILLVLCLAAGWIVYCLAIGNREQSALQSQISAKEELIGQLQEENKTLRQTNEQMETAKAQEHAKTEEEKQSTEEQKNTAPKKDSTVPSRYPTQGSSILQSAYSPEHPSLTIQVYTGGSVIAAADGMVTAVSSDNTYRYIIDIRHDSGYITRYLCCQEAELKISEGTAVRTGDVLLSVNVNDIQLDYQIVYNDAPVDPFTVIDARG